MAPSDAIAVGTEKELPVRMAVRTAAALSQGIPCPALPAAEGVCVLLQAAGVCTAAARGCRSRT